VADPCLILQAAHHPEHFVLAFIPVALILRATPCSLEFSSLNQHPCWLVIPDNGHSTQGGFINNRTSAPWRVRHLSHVCEPSGEP